MYKLAILSMGNMGNYKVPRLGFTADVTATSEGWVVHTSLRESRARAWGALNTRTLTHSPPVVYPLWTSDQHISGDMKRLWPIRMSAVVMFRLSSDTDTWRSVGGRVGQFQRPFCQVLIEFHQWNWDALYLFRNKIVMLIHFDCHIWIAKQNDWLRPDAPTEA